MYLLPARAFLFMGREVPTDQGKLDLMDDSIKAAADTIEAAMGRRFHSSAVDQSRTYNADELVARDLASLPSEFYGPGYGVGDEYGYIDDAYGSRRSLDQYDKLLWVMPDDLAAVASVELGGEDVSGYIELEPTRILEPVWGIYLPDSRSAVYSSAELTITGQWGYYSTTPPAKVKFIATKLAAQYYRDHEASSSGSTRAKGKGGTAPHRMSVQDVETELMAYKKDAPLRTVLPVRVEDAETTTASPGA